MQITQDTAVTLQYTLREVAANGQPGAVLDKGHTAYLHGGYEGIFPKVEAALTGKAVGERINLTLAVEDAFGTRDESLARSIPKSEFPIGVKVGGHLRGTNDQGQPQSYRVLKIKGPVVLLDGNHPLAGKALQFEASVTKVRAALPVEIEHRHVHGEHGHQH